MLVVWEVLLDGRSHKSYYLQGIAPSRGEVFHSRVVLGSSPGDPLPSSFGDGFLFAFSTGLATMTAFVEAERGCPDLEPLGQLGVGNMGAPSPR